MTTDISALIGRVKSDLRWVSERLHDSQEHAQIVRLEEKRERLWAELAALEQKEKE